MNFADFESSSEFQEAAIAVFPARSWAYLTGAELPPPRRSSATQSTPEHGPPPARSTSRSRARRRAKARTLYWDLLSTA
jgi:hypothetical protein